MIRNKARLIMLSNVKSNMKYDVIILIIKSKSITIER